MAWAHAALPWLMGLGLMALSAFVAARWPLRLEVSGKARGEADGRWAVACGVSISVLSLALVWARGMPPQITVLLLGRKLRWKPKLRSERPARPQAPAKAKAGSGLLSRIDPLGLALKLLEERRHFRVRHLVLDLAYGFRDPLLTGRLVGALSALAAVLPPPIVLRQAPRWDFEDGWQVALDGRAVMRPWLILLDTLAYVVRRLLSRKAPKSRSLAAESPTAVR